MLQASTIRIAMMFNYQALSFMPAEWRLLSKLIYSE